MDRQISAGGSSSSNSSSRSSSSTAGTIGCDAEAVGDSLLGLHDVKVKRARKQRLLSAEQCLRHVLILVSFRFDFGQVGLSLRGGGGGEVVLMDELFLSVV